MGTISAGNRVADGMAYITAAESPDDEICCHHWLFFFFLGTVVMCGRPIVEWLKHRLQSTASVTAAS